MCLLCSYFPNRLTRFTKFITAKLFTPTPIAITRMIMLVIILIPQMKLRYRLFVLDYQIFSSLIPPVFLFTASS